VIKGLDEGILSMKVGGKRRLYIPGPVIYSHLTHFPTRRKKLLITAEWISNQASGALA